MFHEPDCRVCRGTGLSIDELSVCTYCNGYGRGGELVRKKIAKAIRTVDQREQERMAAMPGPFKISHYQSG